MGAPRSLSNAGRRLREKLPVATTRRSLAIGAAVLVVAALVWALAAGPLSGGGGSGAESEVVTISVATENAAKAPIGPLGFPLVATRNTTRVGGSDPATDAAAVALATHPQGAGARPPRAIILVGEDDWQAGIAASALAGPPLRLPILVGGATGLPDPTAEALTELRPTGGPRPSDPAVYTVGDVRAPPGLSTQVLSGSSEAQLADSIDRLRTRLLGEPEHIVVASLDDPGSAMPAAAWAARSGDTVLFAGQGSVPPATMAALRRHHRAPVYVLGGPSVISDAAVRQLERASPRVRRVGTDDPVTNAIQFARYIEGGFGWNINDPGHGLVLVNSSRPLDAAASAALSASGTWGPLLVTDEADALPPELRSFFLDIKPGYETDPTRAVYNHVWLIGDASAIGGAVQAEVDDLAELAEIGAGGGAISRSGSSALPGGAEGEPRSQAQGGKGKP